jgi:Trk-type K+ transport system membrane component
MKRERSLDLLLWLAGLTATGLLVAEYGFELDGRGRALVHSLDFLVVAIFVLEALVRLLVVRSPVVHIRRNAPRYLLVFWLVLELPLWTNYGFQSGVAGGAAALLAGKIYLAVVQVYVLLEALVALGRLHGRLARLRVPPLMIGPTPFLLIIAIGTALLSLPRCRTGDWSAIDLLFTATSAVCVTGLATRDVAAGLTATGHGVLMGLIQVGGLGVMTLTAFLAALQGELRGRGHALMLSQLLGEGSLIRARRLLVRIVAVTATVELAGAFMLHGLVGDWTWFTAAFHAVSAFCNAGFSTLPSGLEAFPGRADVLLPVAALIVAGGLGFPVLLAVPGALLGLTFGGGSGLRSEQKRILVTTLVLLLAGWGAFLLLPLPGGPLDRLFESVTTRTAGFSSFTQMALGGPALAVAIILMVIGAAPLSTGGGIKVTTLTLLLEWPWRRRARREQPARHLAVDMALTLTGMYLAIAAIGAMLLILLEGLPLSEALFETVSALSTVGLDRNVTAALSVPGKLVVIWLMISGRVGLFSVLLTLFLPRLRRRCGGETPDIAVG